MTNLYGTYQIFIVDDTAFMRASLSKILQELGVSKGNLIEFENGLEALKALQTYKPNLIFIDWNMPIMSGIEFIKKARANPGPMKNVPIVFVTTVSEKEKIVEALPYGLSGYILKPVTPTIVDRTLRSVLGGEEFNE